MSRRKRSVRFRAASAFTAALTALLALGLAAPPAFAQAAKTTDAPKTDDAKGAQKDAPKAAPAPEEGPPKTAAEPPAEVWDNKDVFEKTGKTYLFVGMRYRGNVVPQFILNAFVDEGATVYTNTVGIELDMRKDGFSLIPALSFAEYGTGNILFKEKNSKDIAGNYNLVNSGLKALYATIDILWSTKISKTVDFEYGLGVGLGIVFGDLVTNWVREDGAARLRGSNGKGYSPCVAVDVPGTGCNAEDHQNADVNRVGYYSESSWFNGGSKPVIFPWLSIPQVGLRFKPIKQFEGRLGLGFALTGFWFGLSGNYGLEKKPEN